MTLIKAMRRRNEALHSIKEPKDGTNSQQPVIDNEEDLEFAKLEKRYISSDSCSTDTDDDSQFVATPPSYHRAMTDPLTERKRAFFDTSESFPTIARFPLCTGNRNCWSEPSHEIYCVRGANYLQDGQKVESEPFLLRARGCDLLLSPDGVAPPKNVGRYVDKYVRAYWSSVEVGVSYPLLHDISVRMDLDLLRQSFSHYYSLVGVRSL